MVVYCVQSASKLMEQGNVVCVVCQLLIYICHTQTASRLLKNQFYRMLRQASVYCSLNTC